MKVYGPETTWPTKKLSSDFRDAFDAAHDAGWTLHHLEAPHTFGFVKCPAGEHSFKITMTARNQAKFAAQGLRDVRNCPHSSGMSGSRVAERKAKSSALIATANSLLDDVEAGLTRAEDYQSSLAELEALNIRLDTAECNIAAARDGQDDSQEAPGEADDDDVETALRSVYDHEGAPTRRDLEAQVARIDVVVAEAQGVADQLQSGRRHVAESIEQQIEVTSARARGARERINLLESAT